MNKKKFIFGILAVMFITLCGVLFSGMPSVFASEGQETEQSIENAGTFEGEGDYIAGETVSLKASMESNYDFLYWMEVNADGAKIGEPLSYELEYTFTTDRDISVKAAWERVGIIEGEGTYQAGQTVQLNAEMDWKYDFLYWVELNPDGSQTVLSYADNNVEDDIYSFEAPHDMTIKAVWKRVGIFEGEGFYVVGSEAYLSANMNPGYDFIGWIQVDDEGNKIGDEYLSQLPIYAFEVGTNMKIRAEWVRVGYNVEFINENDFVFDPNNNTQNSGINYYDDALTINVAIDNSVEGLYVYDLTSENIIINGKTLKDIIDNENPMNIVCEINNATKNDNNDVIGFQLLTITLNVKEDLEISINDYTYMHKLSIVSGTHLAISDLIDFVSVVNNEGDTNTSVYYEQLDQYTYVVCEEQDLTINIEDDNKIYRFDKAAFDDETPSIKHEYNTRLTKDKKFVIYYSKIDYTVKFASYLKNLNEQFEVITSPYNIGDITRQAGDSLNFAYDPSTKQIVVTYNSTVYTWNEESKIYDATVQTFSEEYDYPVNRYGYRHIGFEINGKILVDNEDEIFTYTHTMDSTTPKNVEIKILYEYIKYNFDVELKDNFFENGVSYSVEYLLNNIKVNKVVDGVAITLKADTSTHSIVGWEYNGDLIARPEPGTDNKHSETVFYFKPLSDDNTDPYVVYLDIDYRYFSVEYHLKDTSIEKVIDYDKVIVNINGDNSTITFKDGMGQLADKTYPIKINKEEINAINNSATTYDLNIYGTYDEQNNTYTSSFGTMVDVEDSETGEITSTYVEDFSNVTIANIPINTFEHTTINGVEDESKQASTITESEATITYTYKDVTYSSIIDSTGIAISRTIIHSLTSNYEKCEAEEDGALLIIEDFEELQENQIYLSDTGLDDVVVGDYVVLRNGQSDSVKYEISGTSTYSCDKYLYYGQLQAGVVEYLILESTDGAEGEIITLTAKGTLFNDNNILGLPDQEIYSQELTLKYDTKQNVYSFMFTTYTGILCLTEGETGDLQYINLRGIKYYYDAEAKIFQPKRSQTKTANAISGYVTRYNEYSIKINNLLPDHLVMYSTKTLYPSNYKLTLITNNAGANLTWFDKGDDYNACLLNSTYTSRITVEYYKRAQEVRLVITNENAYSYNNIAWTVKNATFGGTASSADVEDKSIISAYNADEVRIVINLENISAGYKFDGFSLIFGEISVNGNEYVFTMNDDYKGQIIYINFSVIEYIIKVNYYDQEGKAITDGNYTNAHGMMVLDGSNERLISGLVNIEEVYVFSAIAETGYYTSKAVIRNSDYNMYLSRGNSTEDAKTNWTLDATEYETEGSTVFKSAIIDSAKLNDEGMYEVQIDVYFTAHTYTVTINFSIDKMADQVQYPDLYINDEHKEMIKNNIDYVYYVTADGYSYGEDVTVRLDMDTLMEGTRLDSWTLKGTVLTRGPICTISKISENTELCVVLEFIPYTLKFKVVDERGNNCTLAKGTADSVYTWNSAVTYKTESNAGYEITSQYYYDASDNLKEINTEEELIFDPSEFKIQMLDEEYTFTIILKVEAKRINITIQNNTSEYIPNYTGDWATYSIYKNDEEEPLDGDVYEFRTGDTLTMHISTAYMGIMLSSVDIDGKKIIDASDEFYKLVSIKTEKDTVRYYKFTIKFEAGVIDKLKQSIIDTEEEYIVIQNQLTLQKYNITYTYNLINAKLFNVILSIYDPILESGVFSKKDEVKTISNIPYGASKVFGVDIDSMGTEFTTNFSVTNFEINGTLVSPDKNIEGGLSTSFSLIWSADEGLVNYWEQMAISRYHSGDSVDVLVTMILKPNITLQNADEGSGDMSGYKYTKTYNGTAHGLSMEGENPDILLGGTTNSSFKITVEYKKPNGIYTSIKPIDAGNYSITITASVGSYSTIYDKDVSLIIEQAVLKLSFNDPTKYITKEYNGQTGVNVDEFINAIKLDGKIPDDDVKLSKNGLNVFYSSGQGQANANMDKELYDDASLYNIYASGISLVGRDALNYKLAYSSAEFISCGMITAKQLTIVGFVPYDKVYDGTTDVKVSVREVTYIDVLPEDNARILTANLKFYLKETSVGVGREVLVDASEAIIGPDSTNYSVAYQKKTIDIYPREISYVIPGYGAVKLVDKDGLCKINIGAEIVAHAYEKGTEEYNESYTRVQGEIQRGEKLKICYKVMLRVGGMTHHIPKGLYLYLPQANKISQVIQTLDDENIATVECLPESGYTVIKVEEGEARFSILVKATYMPLWVIILIVSLSVLLVGIFTGVIIILRQKSKNKYSAYNKI